MSDPALFGIVALTVTLAFASILAVVFLQKGETFRSSARIKLDFRLMTTGFNPEMFREELKVITSDAVLRRVVEQQQLTEAFRNSHQQPLSVNEALEQLKRLVVLKTIPNAALVEIHVLLGDPVQAAEIANAIAETYQKEILNRTVQTASAPLQELERRNTELAEAALAERIKLKQMEIAGAQVDDLQQQRAVLQEAERAHREAKHQLESATSGFLIPANTLQVFIVDQAIPGTRPIRTHTRRLLMMGIPGAIVLGISAGAVAIVIRRSRGTTRFTPPKRN